MRQANGGLVDKIREQVPFCADNNNNNIPRGENGRRVVFFPLSIFLSSSFFYSVVCICCLFFVYVCNGRLYTCIYIIYKLHSGQEESACAFRLLFIY